MTEKTMKTNIKKINNLLKELNFELCAAKASHDLELCIIRCHTLEEGLNLIDVITSYYKFEAVAFPENNNIISYSKNDYGWIGTFKEDWNFEIHPFVFRGDEDLNIGHKMYFVEMSFFSEAIPELIKILKVKLENNKK